MKYPANSGFLWPGRSSTGMDPFVSSHTRPCGHFKCCTKKKKNNKQRLETDKHGFRTAKHRKVELTLFRVLCLFMAIARTLRKSHTATKNADSSGHRPNFPTLCFGVSLPTDHPEVSLLIDALCPLFRSRRFSRAQLFVWSSRQNKQRKVFWTLWRRFKDKILSLATHPRAHIETPIYIYIYIYIYIDAHYRATPVWSHATSRG